MNRFAPPLVALALAGAAGGAHASVTTITYGGKLGSLINPLVQGFGGRFASGADFTATFRLDGAMGSSTFGPTSSHYERTFPTQAGPLGAAVNIGGAGVDFRCDGYLGGLSFCWVGHTQGGGHLYSSVEDHLNRPVTGPNLVDDYLALTVAAPGAPADFRTPYSYASPTAIGGGMVRIDEDTPVDYYGWAEVVIYSVTVTNDAPAPGIPEPATWTLMILGLGATGSMLRRQRVIARAA
jgi:hypothetical protein